MQCVASENSKGMRRVYKHVLADFKEIDNIFSYHQEQMTKYRQKEDNKCIFLWHVQLIVDSLPLSTIKNNFLRENYISKCLGIRGALGCAAEVPYRFTGRDVVFTYFLRVESALLR